MRAMTRPALHPRLGLHALVALMIGLLVGCTVTEPTAPAESQANSVEPPTTTTTATTTTTNITTTSTTAAQNPDIWTTCRQISIDGDGSVQTLDLTEASGLVASHSNQEVLWTHNDSASAGTNSTAGVFAVGTDGADLGFFELVDQTGASIDGTDTEDIAYRDGRIYLADIGDNGQRRDTVQIHIFDEPNTQPPSSGQVAATTVSLTYPDGPTDAEALLVDPLSNEVVIISKAQLGEVANSRIYSFDLPDLGPGAPPTIEMELVDELDTSELESASTDLSLTALFFPNLVTGADISADGRTIAIRTYATVWLYPRAEGQTMAEALAGQPCEGGSAAESQGEAVAFLALAAGRNNPSGSNLNTVYYATVSEGTNPAINVVTVELG